MRSVPRAASCALRPKHIWPYVPSRPQACVASSQNEPRSGPTLRLEQRPDASAVPDGNRADFRNRVPLPSTHGPSEEVRLRKHDVVVRDPLGGELLGHRRGHVPWEPRQQERAPGGGAAAHACRRVPRVEVP